MKAINRISRFALLPIVVLCFSAHCFAQDALVLSSGTAAGNGAATLNLTIASTPGSEPAAIQWSITYPVSNVISISASAGPALTSAGKSLSCAAQAGTYTCVAAGDNATIIANGSVASINLVMATSVSSTVVGVADPVGALPSGYSVQLSASGGTLSGGALPSVFSISCSPASLVSSASTACTVKLNAPATASGAPIALSSSNSNLGVPATLTLPASAASATFQASAGTIGSNQRATVTATYNGTSANTTVSLVAPVSISSLACNPSSLGPNSFTNCTVGLSQPAPPSGVVVALTNTNATLTVPALVAVSAGSNSGSFRATTAAIPTNQSAASPASSSNQSATLTASYNASSSQTTINLVPSAVTLNSLTCSPATISAGSSATCQVTLNRPSAGHSVVSLTSNNTNLIIPSSAIVPNGGTFSTFFASAATGIASNQSATITAVLSGVSTSTYLTLTPAGTSSSTKSNTQAALDSISCTPNPMTAASHGTCRVMLKNVGALRSENIELSSASPAVRLPQQVSTRTGQSSLEFQIDPVTPAEKIVVAAHLGSQSVSDTIAVVADSSRLIQAPSQQFARPGDDVRFQILTQPGAKLSSGALPGGASFNPATGDFQWAPDRTHLGDHELTFTAATSSGAAASTSVKIAVEFGDPVVVRMVNAASRSKEVSCSPGAIAAIEGRWLISAPAVSDPSGNSTRLSGTAVWINGASVPLLSASETELDILCPDSTPGSQLEIVVETDHGNAAPMHTELASATPGIFSLDGSGGGQGVVTLERTGEVAMVRNYATPSEPASAGDRIVVYTTGAEWLSHAQISMNGVEVVPEAILPVSGHAGVFQVVATVPEGLGTSGSLTISLAGETPEGARVTSNAVTIATETMQ
jgi:uncharacterized protein (TIGR03437 family)